MTTKRKDYTEEEILKAIEGSNGVILNVAQSLICDWSTARKYINKYDSCKAALEAESENILDKAENKLHEKVNDGQMDAVKYILSTKGKKRGYVYREEIEPVNFDEIRITFVGDDHKEQNND